MDARFNGVVEAARMQTLPDDEKMNYFKAMISDKERMEYGEDRFAAGKEEGRAEGRAEGEKKKAMETAKAMLADGVPVQQIAKWTGLTEEQILRVTETSSSAGGAR